MAVTYGGMFTSRIASKEAINAWERLWASILEGKDKDRAKAALSQMFAELAEPFTPAEFNAFYRQQHTKQELYSLPAPSSRLTRDEKLEYITVVRENLKRMSDPSRVVRSQVNIDSGKWKQEMENEFQHHLHILGLSRLGRI